MKIDLSELESMLFGVEKSMRRLKINSKRQGISTFLSSIDKLAC